MNCLKNKNTAERTFIVSFSYWDYVEGSSQHQEIAETTFRVKAINDLEALKKAMLKAIGATEYGFQVCLWKNKKDTHGRMYGDSRVANNYEMPDCLEDMCIPDVLHVLYSNGYGVNYVYDTLTRNYSEDVCTEAPIPEHALDVLYRRSYGDRIEASWYGYCD